MSDNKTIAVDFSYAWVDGWRPTGEIRSVNNGEHILNLLDREVVCWTKKEPSNTPKIIMERDIKIIDIGQYIGKCDFELSHTGQFLTPLLEYRPFTMRGETVHSMWQDWEYYRVRQNDVKYHAGDAQPVPDGLRVTFYEGSLVFTGISHTAPWHGFRGGYKVTGTTEGYQYAWEVES